MKKLLATGAVILSLPFLASAATVAELQAQLQTLMAQISTLQSQQGSTAQPPASCPNLMRNLSRGMKGSDVTSLQQFLITQKLLANDSATGFYGALTEAAVKKFQCSKMNICSGTANSNGYGSVGPRTRAVIVATCSTASETHRQTSPNSAYAQASYFPQGNVVQENPSASSYAQANYYSQASYVAQNVNGASPVELDPRVSIAHVSGKYPERGAGYIVNGAEDAYALGFRAIEVYLSPEICWVTSASRPLGIYQTLDWCNSTDPYSGVSPLKAGSLRDLAQHQRYTDLFAMPFSTFILTTEPTQYGSWPLSLRIAQAPFTQAELDAIYKDYFDLVAYLSAQYKNTGKTFILQTPNEMDWSMIGSSDAAKSPSQTAVNNAINYWNQIQNAVNDARRLVPLSGVKIYHGCEVNLASKAMTGTTTAINSVVPATYCDLYGYSAWDVVLPNASESAANSFATTLNYIAGKAPDSAAFGNNNVYISELGVPETYNGAGSGAVVAAYAEAALAWGAPYVNIWALHDNECSSYLPTSGAGCPGFWMRKPDMSLSSAYDAIVSAFKK